MGWPYIGRVCNLLSSAQVVLVPVPIYLNRYALVTASSVSFPYDTKLVLIQLETEKPVLIDRNHTTSSITKYHSLVN